MAAKLATVGDPGVVIVKLLVVGMCLALVFYVVARFFHRALYEGAPEGLMWRAPLAGALVWLIWMALPMGWNAWMGKQAWPISFNDLFMGDTQSSSGDLQFVEFHIARPDGQAAIYRLDKVRRGASVATVYTDENGAAIPAGTLKMTGVAKDGSRVEFDAVVNAEGNIDKGRDGTGAVRYRATDGRIMTETDFGRLTRPSTASFWIGVLLFLVQVVVWAGCFLLLLQFSLQHSALFGLAGALFWIFVLNFV
jgi:hypothetical protein